MKTTLEIDDRILARAKRAAAEQGITLRALVEDALRARLAPKPESARSYRFEPPVVRGDAPPRVDIADRQALYDVLDGGS